MILRCACTAAFLVSASAACASSAAPGMQVVVKAGRATVFDGITDGTGRFVTAPLEPGVYTFEVRIPKNVVPPPARYFLALSGAKPVGDPMMKKGVPLMMGAEVRRPTSVRGQVTARRVTIVPAATTTAAATPAVTAPATSAVRPTYPGATIGLRSPPAAVTTAPSRTSATPAAARPAAARATAQPAPMMRRAATTTQPVAAPTQSTTGGLAVKPPTNEPRMINGRLHAWVPIAPGSTLGRWVPERAERSSTATPRPAATGRAMSSPQSTPKPSPTPRRR
jgi:hypothetical protein